MKIPYHVAIIMDGNGRWAKRRGLPRNFGHKKGAERIREIIECSKEIGVKILTLFAFSTENWDRPKNEIKHLFSYLKERLEKDKEKLVKEDVRVIFFGRRDKTRIGKDLLDKIYEVEQLTKKCKSIIVNIAFDYGGKWDIVNAAKNLAKDILKKRMSLEKVNEKVFAGYLSLSEFPPPDILIRTSGEIRISNFLLWQLAYSELYFTKVLWPDFGKKAFMDAIREYSRRKRRFGKVEE